MAVVLMGVGDGKLGDGFIKAIVGDKVTANHRSIARLRVRARQRPAALSRVESQPAGTDAFDQRLDLGVVKLADVKMPPFIFGPSEKEVARRLHQPLTNDNTLTAIGVTTLPGIRFEHTHARFLYLEKERVLGVRHQQQNSAHRADAAHAYDLDGDVLQLKAIQQVPAFVAQRLAILTERGLNSVTVFAVCGDVSLMEDERRIIFDARLAAFDGRQLRKIILEDRARNGFFNLRLYLSPPFFSPNRPQDLPGLDVFIPALKHSHSREVWMCSR